MISSRALALWLTTLAIMASADPVGRMKQDSDWIAQEPLDSDPIEYSNSVYRKPGPMFGFDLSESSGPAKKASPNEGSSPAKSARSELAKRQALSLPGLSVGASGGYGSFTATQTVSSSLSSSFATSSLSSASSITPSSSSSATSTVIPTTSSSVDLTSTTSPTSSPPTLPTSSETPISSSNPGQPSGPGGGSGGSPPSSGTFTVVPGTSLDTSSPSSGLLPFPSQPGSQTSSVDLGGSPNAGATSGTAPLEPSSAVVPQSPTSDANLPTSDAPSPPETSAPAMATLPPPGAAGVSSSNIEIPPSNPQAPQTRSTVPSAPPATSQGKLPSLSDQVTRVSVVPTSGLPPDLASAAAEISLAAPVSGQGIFPNPPPASSDNNDSPNAAPFPSQVSSSVLILPEILAPSSDAPAFSFDATSVNSAFPVASTAVFTTRSKPAPSSAVQGPASNLPFTPPGSSDNNGGLPPAPVPASSSSTTANVIFPLPQTSVDNQGNTQVSQSLSTAPVTANAPASITSTDNQGNPHATSSSVPALVFPTTDDQGNGVTTTSPLPTGGPVVSGSASASQSGDVVVTTDQFGNVVTLSGATDGAVITTTDAAGRTITTTYNPRGSAVRSLVVETSTLPNGDRATLTSVAVVVPSVAETSNAQQGAGPSNTGSAPGLVTGNAGVASRKVGKEAVALVAGAAGVAWLL